MDIGKVIGNIISVAKIEELKPLKLFLVQLLDHEYNPGSNFIVAIDTIGVGFGDFVILTQGGSSRFTELSRSAHTDASIVARIDNFDFNN